MKGKKTGFQESKQQSSLLYKQARKLWLWFASLVDFYPQNQQLLYHVTLRNSFTLL